jgi:hypothetical protein
MRFKRHTATRWFDVASLYFCVAAPLTGVEVTDPSTACRYSSKRTRRPETRESVFLAGVESVLIGPVLEMG